MAPAAAATAAVTAAATAAVTAAAPAAAAAAATAGAEEKKACLPCDYPTACLNLLQLHLNQRVDLMGAPLVTSETVNFAVELRHVDFVAAAAVAEAAVAAAAVAVAVAAAAVAAVDAAAEENAVDLVVVVLQALKPQTQDSGRSVRPEDFQ